MCFYPRKSRYLPDNISGFVIGETGVKTHERLVPVLFKSMETHACFVYISIVNYIGNTIPILTLMFKLATIRYPAYLVSGKLLSG